MGAAALTGMQGAGTLLGAYGTVKASEAEAQQMEVEAQFKQQQAEEIAYRNNMNLLDIKREGEIFKGEQSAVIAGSGFDISGSPFNQLVETDARIRYKMLVAQREADYQKKLAYEQSKQLYKSAYDTRKGGKIKALASVLGGGADIAKNYDPNKTPQLGPDKLGGA